MKHLYKHSPVIWRKVVRGTVEGSPSQLSQLYRASVQQKKVRRLTELTAASRLSPEFTQILIFLQAFNKQLYHSRRATQLHQFEPDSDFGSIFFLNYNTHACSWIYSFAKLTRVGKPNCIPAWQKVFPGRRVTLPSKASGLARWVALLVLDSWAKSVFRISRNNLTSFPKKCKESWLAQGILRRQVTLPPGIWWGLSLRCWNFY